MTRAHRLLAWLFDCPCMRRLEAERRRNQRAAATYAEPLELPSAIRTLNRADIKLMPKKGNGPPAV